MKEFNLMAAWVILLAATSAVVADPLSEESCSVVVTKGDGKVVYWKVEGLKVLERDPSIPLNIGADEPDVVIKGIICWRSEVRFAQHDYLVARQYPLYIKSEHEDQSQDRSASLEYTSAGYRIRLLSGPPWDEAEKEEMRQRVKEYNATIDDSPSKTTEPARQ